MQVEDAIRDANRKGFDELVLAGFGFDPSAQDAIESGSHPKLRMHMALMRPDVYSYSRPQVASPAGGHAPNQDCALPRARSARWAGGGAHRAEIARATQNFGRKGRRRPVSSSFTARQKMHA